MGNEPPTSEDDWPERPPLPPRQYLVIPALLVFMVLRATALRLWDWRRRPGPALKIVLVSAVAVFVDLVVFDRWPLWAAVPVAAVSFFAFLAAKGPIIGGGSEGRRSQLPPGYVESSSGLLVPAHAGPLSDEPGGPAGGDQPAGPEDPAFPDPAPPTVPGDPPVPQVHVTVKSGRGLLDRVVAFMGIAGSAAAIYLAVVTATAVAPSAGAHPNTPSVPATTTTVPAPAGHPSGSS